MFNLAFSTFVIVRILTRYKDTLDTGEVLIIFFFSSLSVSYHGMFGPIRMFLTMNHSVQSEEHVQAVQKKVYRMSTSSQVCIDRWLDG